MNEFKKAQVLIENVPLPFESYEKLLTISRMGNTTPSDVASQALQEWLMENFGKRYPSDQ